MHEYLPRDFVETAEGLFFAVLANQLDEQRLPAFLRYIRQGDSLRKLSTDEANQFLESSHPGYHYYSSRRDVRLHGIPVDRIQRHHSARRRASQILKDNVEHDIEHKCRRVMELLIEAGVDAKRIGVSGSLAIGAHHSHSDIDLVVYDRQQFLGARDAVRQATSRGVFQPLDAKTWRETYDRRGCSLPFTEFLWHELRKHNKLVIDGTKVDISLVVPDAAATPIAWKKIAKKELRARVIDDSLAFDYPSRLNVDHPEISEIVIYTPTYAGQAFTGELVVAKGWQERSTTGDLRLLIGTSREARDEFVKVVQEPSNTSG